MIPIIAQVIMLMCPPMQGSKLTFAQCVIYRKDEQYPEGWGLVRFHLSRRQPSIEPKALYCTRWIGDEQVCKLISINKKENQP